MEYMKNLFYEADLDKSGLLSLDEIYNLLTLKLEVDIRREELSDMIGFNDEDGDNQVNIDEFINLMSDSLNSEGSMKETIIRIKQASKLNIMDFALLLKRLPKHYEESFTKKLYSKRKNLPSSAFMPMMNQNLLFTDIMPPLRNLA